MSRTSYRIYPTGKRPIPRRRRCVGWNASKPAATPVEPERRLLFDVGARTFADKSIFNLKPLVAASGDSERASRMILGRCSPSSIFLMRVSIAIDSIRVAWSPIAICDQSAK